MNWLALLITVLAVGVLAATHRWRISQKRLHDSNDEEVSTLFPIPPYQYRRSYSYGTSLKGIPLVLYLSWGSSEIPYYMKRNIEIVQEANPEFDISFSDDAASRAFLVANFDADVVKAFDCLKPGAYKSDLWRYCILYTYGGVYMDIKCRPDIRIVDMIQEYGSPVFVQDFPRRGLCVWNGFMIAPPNLPIFKMCISDIIKNVKANDYTQDTLSITGPCLLGKLFTIVYPNYKFNLFLDGIGGGTYAIVDAKGTPIVPFYKEYRMEQKHFQKGGHYVDAWNSRDVYAC